MSRHSWVNNRFAFLYPCIFLILFSCQKTPVAEYIFTFSHLANEDNTWHLAAKYFDEILNERTNGKVRVQVFANEQLGKEVEVIRSIRTGITDITITAGTLQNWAEEATFTDLPFLLRDTIHLRALADGLTGKFIEKQILDKTGLLPICYFQRGPRYLTSNRPITDPSELDGIILRVPNVPSYVAAWKALGAKPTPMAFSEVFTSLQQGTVEAQENPMAMISSAKFAEVQEYLNLTGHVISWVYVVVGKKQFDAMPKNYQDIFLEAARDMQHYEHELFLQKETELANELKGAGMKFISVDSKAFETIGSKAIFESLSPEMQKLYLQIKAL